MGNQNCSENLPSNDSPEKMQRPILLTDYVPTDKAQLSNKNKKPQSRFRTTTIFQNSGVKNKVVNKKINDSLQKNHIIDKKTCNKGTHLILG